MESKSRVRNLSTRYLSLYRHGIALIIFGHYLWVGLKLPETMGVQGIILVAACCALGLILSLPTKIYLTILLMQYEAETILPAQQAKNAATPVGAAKNR